MTHSADRRPVGDFDHALSLLDHELEGLELDEPIQIRAIGGYALLKHGIREDERALTVDIDTMTRDYSAAVQAAIETVAERTGLAKDWLNNDNLGGNDPDEVAAIYDAEWEPQDDGLKNIDMAIASVPTLTRAKIIAADTAQFSDRDQDGPDLVRLIEHQGIESLAAYRAKYPDPFEEYPEAGELMQGYYARKKGAAGPSTAERMQRLSDEVAGLDWGDEFETAGYDDYY